MPTKRIHYLDIARAIAIFSIVLGHTIAYSTHCYEIYRFIFAFSVPLFFVLSGMTFRLKEETTWQFIKRKFLRIMIPYFVWAILFLVPYYLFGSNFSSELSQPNLLGVLYGSGADSALKQNTPLWFLPALFTTELLYYFLLKIFRHPKTPYFLLPAVLLIGYITTIFLGQIILPWGINSALTIGVFFYLGYLLKNYNFKPIFAALLFILGLIAFIFNSHDNVIWSDYQYNNYFLTIIAGATFAFSIIAFAKYLGKNHIIEYVGQNTMSILIFHKLIVVIFQTKLGTITSLSQNSNLILELLSCLVASVIAVIFSLICDKLLCKIKLKALLGKS